MSNNLFQRTARSAAVRWAGAFSFLFKKINGRGSVFGLEISAALLLKFLLLGGLWWLFFKGHKLPVDGDVIAAKLFGENQPVTQMPKSPEKR
jgi:hypothetical protein